MPRGLSNLVQQTSDYEQFSLINANRDQNRGHVEALKKAFEEVGNLTRVQPILVNGRYEIIDGQHRFTACKELGLPIYFTMVDGLGIAEARSMNILHRNWTTADYAKSYAESGNRHYQKYLVLREDYGFTHSVTLAYIMDNQGGTGGSGGNVGAFKAFRTGDMVIEDEKAVRSKLDKLAEIGEFTDLVKHRPFALALLKVMKSDEYNQKRMVKKVRLLGDRVLKRYANLDDNLRMLEDLYNYRQPAGSTSRLF